MKFLFYILKQGYMKLINKLPVFACFVHILANMCLTYSLNETVFIHAILDWISHAFVSVSRMAFHHYVHAILIMHGYSLCKLKTMQSRSFAVSVLPVVLVYIRLFWIKYNDCKVFSNPCRHLHVEVEEVLDISTCISYMY